MAIVETTGLVESLKLAPDAGFVTIRSDAGRGPRSELLIIWWADQSEGPAALFTTELSMALARKLRVRCSHQQDSAYIFQVIVEAGI